LADDTYDPARVEQLLAMLRALSARIAQLDAEGRLLQETSALLKQLGDVRTELFRYEVRTTFDSPEIAEHRRMIAEAGGWLPGTDEPGTDEEEGWPSAS
jgi:hypothetical protein